MNADNLLKLASNFLIIAQGPSLKVILKTLDQMETFSERIKYAKKHLSHFSSGSSRIVYLTPAGTVIKLAKNEKGEKQNQAEANPKVKSKYLNKIISHSKKDVWLQTHFLKKITTKQFKKLTGIDFDDFGDALRYGLKSMSSNSSAEKPSDFDEIAESEVYQELLEIGKKNHLLPGDLTRISSFGMKDDHPVLLDAGLTKKIFEDFYESS